MESPAWGDLEAMLALGDTLEWWLGSAELMAGLGDLKGVFQCKQFYNSM